MYITITDEMKKYAKLESKKRESYIKHHFTTSHFSNMQSNEIGFLGEFAICTYLNIDWKKNIRLDYKTIDTGDGKINNKVFDVKTETIPGFFLKKLLSNNLKDTEAYGKRWINVDQASLLRKYDIIIFGAFNRDDTSYSKWYPLGWVKVEQLKNFKATKDSTKKKSTAAIKVPHSMLKPMNLLNLME